MALSKAAVREAFRRDLERLQSSVRSIPADRLQAAILDDSWTAKDILAHIAAWDRALVRAIGELSRGAVPAMLRVTADEFNRSAVAQTSGADLDGVITEVREAHEAMLAAIEAITDDAWERDTGLRWSKGASMTLASLFTYEYKGETHYAGHAAEIKAWLQQRPDLEG